MNARLCASDCTQEEKGLPCYNIGLVPGCVLSRGPLRPRDLLTIPREMSQLITVPFSPNVFLSFFALFYFLFPSTAKTEQLNKDRKKKAKSI